jgi:ApeA N-terminal domain 1
VEELFGQWWVPGQARCYGRLRIEDDLFTLDLTSNPVPGASVGYELPVMHGESEGRPISLFRLGETARSISGGGTFPERLVAGEVVLGDHLRSWRAAAFREVEVRPPHLNEFAGRSGLSLEDVPATRRVPRRRRVEWAEVEETALTVNGVRVRFRSDPAFEYVSHFEFRLQQEARISLRSQRPISLGTWDRRWIDTLCSLISFGVERPVSVDRWFAYHEPVTSTGPRGRTIEVRARRRRQDPLVAPVSMFDTPFLTLADLGSGAAAAIRGFERFRRQHKEAAELLFEYQVLSSRSTPPDRFLNLARFLEAFHRSKFGGPRSAQPNFRDRLADVLRGPGAAAAPYIGRTAGRLIDLVRDTRNYYVHYDPRKEAKAAHDVELDYLADRLWMVVRACVMNEVGIPEDVSGAALQRDPLADYLAATRLRRPAPRKRI